MLYVHNDYQIRYLIERKFPSQSNLVNHWGADSYRTELEAKSTEEVKALYDQELLKERQEKREKMEQEEPQRFFNHPYADADFEYSSKLPVWTLNEAVALVFKKDPELVTWENMKNYKNMSPFADEYARVTKLAFRAKGQGQLTDPVEPPVFLAWAKKMGIEVPPELVEQVAKQAPKMAEWQDICRKLKDQKEPDSLLESERNSLLKLVLGMAISKYGYSLGSTRNTATGDNKQSISDDLLQLGLKLNSDTVRKYIKEAEEQFSDLITKSDDS